MSDIRISVGDTHCFQHSNYTIVTQTPFFKIPKGLCVALTIKCGVLFNYEMEWNSDRNR